jgi:hypothetical protein
MSHMIEDNQIAWNTVNGKPWHGLGTEVPAGTSGEEMLQLAGLDFPVEAMDIVLAGLPDNTDILSPDTRQSDVPILTKFSGYSPNAITFTKTLI